MWDRRLDFICPFYQSLARQLRILPCLQCDMGIEILAACKEIYKRFDVHMTDSTEHNKGIAPILSELYDLETKAGQIFCNPWMEKVPGKFC